MLIVTNRRFGKHTGKKTPYQIKLPLTIVKSFMQYFLVLQKLLLVKVRWQYPYDHFIGP